MARTRTRTPDEVSAGESRLSIAQAADRLGVSHWTVRRRISDGSLTAYRYGPRLIRVNAVDVDNLGKIIPTVGTCGGARDAS